MQCKFVEIAYPYFLCITIEIISLAHLNSCNIMGPCFFVVMHAVNIVDELKLQMSFTSLLRTAMNSLDFWRMNAKR